MDKATGFDIKRFIFRLCRNYPWFLLSVAVFLTGTHFYLKNLIPMHQVSTSILLHPEQVQRTANDNFSINESETIIPNENFKDIVNNEVFILKSRSIISGVVDSLKLEIGLFNGKKNVSTDAAPFVVSVFRKNKELPTPVYALQLLPGSFTLEKDNKKYRGIYGQPLITQNDTITVKLKEGVIVGSNNQYGLQFSGRSSTIGKYVSRVSVSAIPKAGIGMVQVSVEDEFYIRAKQIIEVLIYQFNLSNLQYKNQAERLALDFLNKRIDALEGELKAQETEVSNFKAQNKIYDVSVAANQLLTSLGSIDVQKSQNDLKGSLLSLVEKNIRAYNGVEEIVPNANGLQDDVLADLINQYNKLVLNKRMILDQGTPEDPRLFAVNGQLEQIRNNILKNVENIRHELTTNRYSLSGQERNFSAKFEGLPKKEKDYIQLSRSLGIKESLYLYLLQKREESSVRLVSSDMAQSRIVDEGIYKGVVSPNKRFTYLTALSAGLLLPGLVILLISLLNKKVESREDIETSLGVPIIGEIGTAPKKNRVMILSSGKEMPVAEQLRSLRASLFSREKIIESKVLLVTSYMRGEGKSFISMNIADTLAAAGKKVVLLDFDLRKAILSRRLDSHTSDGLSTFLTIGLSNYLNGQAEVDQIAYRLGESKDNIVFVPSGSFVSNPGELILSDRMPSLFDYLKSNFDYVIVDTPPVGFVSDAITIANWADSTLFIIRHNYSQYASVKLIKELHESSKLPNLSVVMNGIRKGRGYEYGGYGSGYNYYSYAQTKQKKFPLI